MSVMMLVMVMVMVMVYHASSLLVRHIMLHDWCKLGFKINFAKSSISILVLVVWVVNIVRIKGERKYLGSE